MNEITKEQAFAIVDHAANTNMLYHFNGNQAYIRLAPNTDVMMVVSTAFIKPVVEVYDGALYLKANKGNNIWCSANHREHTPLVEWWESHKKENA